MPCYQCGARQIDPERGTSSWQRGVRRDRHVLICPACQSDHDWRADLDTCERCGSIRLVSRLGEIECLACGDVRPVRRSPAAPAAAGSDTALSDQVTRALDRILHDRRGVPG